MAEVGAYKLEDKSHKNDPVWRRKRTKIEIKCPEPQKLVGKYKAV